MSYILEALKKADQEHDIGAVPGLTTPQETERPQTRFNRWLLIIVLLLSANAVLVVMLLKDEDAGAPVAVKVPPERQAALTNDQLVEPIQQTSEPLVNEAPTPEKQVLPEKGRTLASGEVVVLPGPVNLQDPRPPILSEEELDVRLDAMTSSKDNSQLQSWYELPREFRNKLDLPRLDVHVYSEEPGRRFIMVNQEKYREGERLASGLVLEEILPDGMVMSYQGERFRVEK